jgi:hypothetical protein
MVSTDFGSSGVILNDGQSSHFASPVNHRGIQKTSLLQVFDQSR